MRYRIRKSTKPDEWIYITVDKKLTNEKEEIFLPGDEWKAPFIAAIFGIEGVIETRLQRYDLVLKKAEVFNWEEITPIAVRILREYLDPNGTMVNMEKEQKKNPQTDKK